MAVVVATYKLVLVGDGGVGKTTFVKRVRTHEYMESYVPTLGVEVHPLRFKTTRGQICFNIWDTAGQEKLRGMAHGYYVNADACMVMYASNDNPSKERIGAWVEEVVEIVGGERPLIILQNKCDLGSNPSWSSYPTFSLSTLSGNNLYGPFLHLARELMGDPTLEFI